MAALHVLRKPSNTILIFSSGECLRRVWRRMSRTTFSVGYFLLIDFHLIFVPFGLNDEPEILPYENPSMGPIGADVRQRQKINKLTIHNRRLNHQRQAA